MGALIRQWGCRIGGALLVMLFAFSGENLAQQAASEKPSLTPAPDIRDVEPDLEVPKLSAGQPSSGKRVRVQLDSDSELYYVLYLPTNYEMGKSYPVIVELAGNKYKNKLGDVSLGLPEGSNLGYGATAGKDFIWVCVPFVTSEKKPRVASWWWGSPPAYDIRPSVSYCKKVVQQVCRKYGGDSKRVVLAGFSRGAIACNVVGLHDDDIAKLWCGFIAFSHYDGVRDWHLPETDKESAKRRMSRLGKRPQFVCAESNWLEKNGQLEATRKWILSVKPKGEFTFRSTGFRNHNDAWVLRPSPARKSLRSWLKSTIDAVE